MEQFYRPPEPLKNNNPKAWKIWKEEFLIFMELTGHMNRTQEYKANVFKNFIGTVGLETISMLSFNTAKDKDNLDILLKKLDEYYFPPRKETLVRYEFFNRSKRRNESIENYIQVMKELAKECEFGNLTESLVRDIIILHTHDDALRNKFHEVENLTCEKIIELYKNHKFVKPNNENSSKDPSGACKKESKAANGATNKTPVGLPTAKNEQKASVNYTYKKNCWRCGTKHQIKNCPAWDHKCRKCSVLHHYESCCDNASKRNKCINNLNEGKEKQMDKCKLFFEDNFS